MTPRYLKPPNTWSAAGIGTEKPKWATELPIPAIVSPP